MVGRLRNVSRSYVKTRKLNSRPQQPSGFINLSHIHVVNPSRLSIQYLINISILINNFVTLVDDQLYIVSGIKMKTKDWNLRACGKMCSIKGLFIV